MAKLRTATVDDGLSFAAQLGPVSNRAPAKTVRRIIGAALREPSEQELVDIGRITRDTSRLAAQYVRMSTDYQQYSTANQRDAIARYAEEKGLQIVRTYADEGKSGLNLRDRDGLRELLHDVLSGAPGFGVVLVFDVSRWGRFQDIDEAAHYEYLCRNAGIHVEYCAEPFCNDGSPMASVIKGLKRVMAGEYSRELSEKVHWAKCRLIGKGFRQGGMAGFGLRRMVVDAQGQPRGIIAKGQHKFLQTDRVLLVPGPPEELAVLRGIFERAADGWRPRAIARELNARGVPGEDGAPWNRCRLTSLLSNEKYIGTNVFNRTSARLKGRVIHNPSEKWIRIEKAFPAVVRPELFYRAQAAMAKWTSRITNEKALEMLRDLVHRKGYLSERLIDSTPGMPGSSLYINRFGGLTRAYALVGFRPKRDYAFLEGHLRRRRRNSNLRGEVFHALLDGGSTGSWEPGGILNVAGGVRIAIRSAYCNMVRGKPTWRVQLHKPKPDWVLIERYGREGQIQDYCLARGGNDVQLGVSPRRFREIHFASTHEALLEVVLARGGVSPVSVVRPLSSP